MLKAGFIGCGNHATLNIYPVLRLTNIDLIAVCDLKEDLARRNARNFGALRWYTNYREMLNKENLDVLFIVIGPREHYEIAKIAMKEYGLHVFTEKPPSETVDEAIELLEISNKYNRYLMTAFMKRFATSNTLLKDAISQPEFGIPRQYEARYTASPYNDEKSFLLHHVIHHADLMRFFMGDLKNLFSRKVIGSNNRFGYQILVEFKNSATGVITLNCLESWGSPNERIAIVGDGHLGVSENGMFTWYRNTPIRGFIDEPGIDRERDALIWSQNISWATLYSNRGYEKEVDHFVKSIEMGIEPSPNARDALESMRIIEAIKKSSDSGEIIDF